MTTERKNFRSITLASLGLGLAVAAATPAHAGLLDLIFGGARPAPAPTYAPIPDVPGDLREVKPGPRKVEEAKPRIQIPMDVSNDPEWYLRDPTLRKGDIIVLADRVLVYNGGGRDKRDFAELGNSSLSKKDRQSILALTEAPRESLVTYRGQPVARTFQASAGEDQTAGLETTDTIDPAAALRKR